MPVPLVLLLIGAVVLVAAFVVAIVDFIEYSRTKAREAREFAFRRHVRPNHMVHDGLGDPLTCWEPSHNHNPQDFGQRFRARSAAQARAVALFLLVLVATILSLTAGGLAFARLFI